VSEEKHATLRVLDALQMKGFDGKREYVASALSGSTKPTIGIREFVSVTVISWSELTSPPGVSIVRRTKLACSLSARSSARARWRTLSGLTTPSRRSST